MMLLLVLVVAGSAFGPRPQRHPSIRLNFKAPGRRRTWFEFKPPGPPKLEEAPAPPPSDAAPGDDLSAVLCELEVAAVAREEAVDWLEEWARCSFLPRGAARRFDPKPKHKPFAKLPTVVRVERGDRGVTLWFENLKLHPFETVAMTEAKKRLEEGCPATTEVPTHVHPKHKRAGCVSVTAETNPERNDTLIVIAKRGGYGEGAIVKHNSEDIIVKKLRKSIVHW